MNGDDIVGLGRRGIRGIFDPRETEQGIGR